MDVGKVTLIAGALLAAGLVASLAAPRLRLPGLVLFLGVGMVVGLGRLRLGPFQRLRARAHVGIVALALILFEGGLASGFDEIRPVLRPAAISLALIGTLVTALIGGFVAAWLFDMSTLEGLLLGSIVASTDGAAIFAVLRGSTLRRRLARTLEGESGMNDPVAVLLVLGFIDWIEKPGIRHRRHGAALRAPVGHRARRRDSSSGWAALYRRFSERGSARGPVPGRVGRDGRARLRRRRRAARLGVPRRVPRRALARLHAHPRASARSRRSTMALPGSPSSPCSSTLGLLVFPSRARRRGAGGHGARLVHRAGRAPAGRRWRRPRSEASRCQSA